MTSYADANMSDWVSQVRDRHGGGYEPSTKSTPDDSLEEEIERSRAERAKRRSQLVGASPSSPTKESPSSDHDRLRSAYATPSFASSSSSSPPKRGQTLLDRYGGQHGPTGTARAGTSDSPASLASFMGGRASGPRLGKLQGDGRTTPPEAKLIDYTNHRPLPGMETNAAGGKSLASFLEARASREGQAISRPRSPEKNTSSRFSAGASSHLSVETSSNHDAASHRDRATSPLKAEQIINAKEMSPSQEAYAKSSTERISPNSTPKVSSAFSSTQQSTDRMPSASLTRLQSKKMVEQRVREAQQRDVDEQTQTSAVKSAPPWMASTPETAKAPISALGNTVKGRWPEVKATDALASERRSGTSLGQFGHALPGMSDAKISPTRNLYAVNNRKDSEERREPYSAPIRLPGMGSAESPFLARQNAQQREEIDTSPSQPLENLTKGRVKPKRMARASAAFDGVKSSSPERTDADGEADTDASLKRGLPLSVDTAFLNSSIRQDSLPDSAEKRIADSTAALEALVQGEMLSTPIREKERAVYQPDPTPRKGTLRIARNKDSHITIDSGAVLHASARSPQAHKKTVSLEVISIKSDGLKIQLRGEEQKTLYETETQVIIYRYRNVMSNALAITVYARAGRLSKLLSSPHSLEAKMIQEIGRQYSTGVVDSRQGREAMELARLLGGVLITREGNRNSHDEESSYMFEVRGSEGAHFVDQVDMLSTSLCSAHSVIVIMQRDAFVWHGVGSVVSNRKVACEYGRQLSLIKSGNLREYEEGHEGDLFRSCFDGKGVYSNAWHHRFRHVLPTDELSPRLFSLQGSGNSKKLVEQVEFSALDIRRDGLHILDLPLELYVLVGPEARSRRKEILACIETATALSKQTAQSRGAEIMTSPVHVVVFPSIVPRELKSAFRYWHDEHLNGKSWQKAALGMNVWERQAAMEQLQTEEFPLWQLNDELFLPVGVGLEDVQGIDV